MDLTYGRFLEVMKENGFKVSGVTKDGYHKILNDKRICFYAHKTKKGISVWSILKDKTIKIKTHSDVKKLIVETPKSNSVLQYWRIIKIIRKFQPYRDYKRELPYQVDLARFLECKFKDVTLEEQRGSSKPDIIVKSDTAIEVKGPTKSHDLDTVASKCMRYCQHYENVIVVLFNLEVNEKYYLEWKLGMKDKFSNIEIISKQQKEDDE